MEQIATMRAKMEEMKKQMAEAAKANLQAEFQSLFSVWPEAEAIRWTQYTPYFNDGEPCVFRVNEPFVKVGDEGGDDDDGFLYEYELEKESEGRERLRAIASTLESCEDVLQFVFGDHCQVTIWRDKTEAEVEEYSHD